MIEMVNITKKIDDLNLDILRDINLHINSGELVSIMGKSGSGKSTLMNIIGCLDRPSEGTYVFNSLPIEKATSGELASIRNKSIGFVFQNFHLLPRLNALQNVELPLIYAGIKKEERLEKCHKVLEKVGLKDRVLHKPSELSGGQKQRVAIARAIVNSPKLILADEPTGALDTNTSSEIMELFKDINHSNRTTIIIVTHEEEIANSTERILYIKDGYLMNQERNYKQYVNS